ncbi:MAG: GNAT family N-acetyltransferase [Pseudomonadota bacterium]
MADLEPIASSYAAEVARTVERELLASLASINRQAPTFRRTFYIKDHNGDLKAGLTCSTAYGWLHIEALWVAAAHRSQSLGRQLMGAAETFGRDNRCHGAWLDTSNPAAAAFYRKLGYAVFGELINNEDQFPPEHRRWFLKRIL